MVTLALGLMLLSSQGTKPDEYNEKWLCDLYAGAQCYASACLKDGKARCEQAKRSIGLPKHGELAWRSKHSDANKRHNPPLS
jgi:hypothetical protein